MTVWADRMSSDENGKGVKAMKKTFLSILMLTATMLALASCLPDTPDPPPEGVWVSEEPRIVLFLMPEYRLPVGMPEFIALYTIEDVETKVFVLFGNGLEFEILDYTGRCGEIGALVRGAVLLSGTYRVVRNEIHWSLLPTFRERLGVSTVIFRQIENYNPIDPYDWSPQFFPRTEGDTHIP